MAKLFILTLLITSKYNGNSKFFLPFFSGPHCTVLTDTIPAQVLKQVNDSISAPEINKTAKEKTIEDQEKSFKDSILILQRSVLKEKSSRKLENRMLQSVKDSLKSLQDFIYKHFCPPGSSAYRISFNERNYACFEVNPKVLSIKMHLKDQEGNIFGKIDSVTHKLDAEGKFVIFCTNGGMFKNDYMPQGLFIEDGKVLQNEDLRKGLYGNFYIEPNGVFYITNEREAGLLKTSELTDSLKAVMLFATQSGPMVVSDNMVNESFKKNSPNVNIRSGVGILPDGNVVFVISEEKVNFYDFATVFKDKLKCSTALYLDGAISESFIPALGKFKTSVDFGPIISVSK